MLDAGLPNEMDYSEMILECAIMIHLLGQVDASAHALQDLNKRPHGAIKLRRGLVPNALVRRSSRRAESQSCRALICAKRHMRWVLDFTA